MRCEKKFCPQNDVGMNDSVSSPFLYLRIFYFRLFLYKYVHASDKFYKNFVGGEERKSSINNFQR